MGEGRVGREGHDPDGAGRTPEMPAGCNHALVRGAPQPPEFLGEWQEGRLRDIAQLHREHVVPNRTNDTPYTHFSLPAYDAGKTPTIESGAAIRSGKFRVPNNAVLVSRLNPRIARVWAPAFAESNAVASTEFLVLTPRKTTTRAFLYFLCSSLKFWERMVLSVTGTTGSHQRVNRYDAMKLAIRFPEDTAEQRAIAVVLSDVEKLIGSLEALVAKKRSIKQAAMQQLLTGRTRLPGFGGEWGVTVLGSLTDIRNGGTPRTGVPSYWGGRIPWCVPTDITACRGKRLAATTRSITPEGLASCGASLLPAGTLLLCSRATIGEIKIASMPVATNQGFKSLVCGDAVDYEFLYHRMLTLKKQMIEVATGSTFLEISKRDVANIRIDLPTLPEQQAIATILSDMDAEITALERRLDKTRAIKQGMMQQLLTGSIRLPIPEHDTEEDDAHDA